MAPVLIVYKMARARGRNGAAWLLGTGVTIVGVHLAALMVIGFLMRVIEIEPGEVMRPDVTDLRTAALLIEGIAVLLSLVVNGVALYFVTRPGKTFPGGPPPPPPSFDDKI